MEFRYLKGTDDRDAVSGVYEESWRYAYKRIIPQNYLDSIPKGRWAANLDIPGWSSMVAVKDGEIVGTGSFCAARMEKYNGTGEIISMYFLPEYIGKGYGRQFMESVLKELRKAGFSEVYSGRWKRIRGPDAFTRSSGSCLQANIRN